MAYEIIQGALRQTRLTNESAEYRERREELRLAEIDLMQRRERVAALRRRLPPGATIEDYIFQEGPADLNAGDLPTRSVRLSELFSGPDRSVVVYHLMYGKKQTSPCPMCTMWIDGYNGVAHHLAQNVDFVIAANPPFNVSTKLIRRWMLHPHFLSGALIVEDTGPGLRQEDLPRAFERFYLYSRYSSDRPVGTGLGLSIVKELTQGMGGSVEVAAAAGSGTRFTVRLRLPRTTQDGFTDGLPAVDKGLTGSGEDGTSNSAPDQFLSRDEAR